MIKLNDIHCRRSYCHANECWQNILMWNELLRLWCSLQSERTAQFHTVLLCLYVVVPTTSLASNSALGTLFSSGRSLFGQLWGEKKHSRLCLYYHNNITKTLSLNFFYKNYIAHYSCHFPQHVKWAPGRVRWRGAGLFKWLNRCSQLVWTDGAGHLLWRSRARGRGESEGDRRQNTSLPLEPPHRNMSSKCPKCEKTVYFGE